MIGNKKLKIIGDESDNISELQREYESLNCKDENYYSKDCNAFLVKKENLERTYLEEHKEDSPLYPNLNDKDFNLKITGKKEFNDTKYDGDIYEDIKAHADKLAAADFELSPHQIFVKNFMSFNTPYNSLLLYHGLGTGKTCSAIGVCEEMRDYMKQTGINKRIIIVASKNVQTNFRSQLFDDRKLENIDGIWNIRSCTGNKLLKEINPMSMKGLSEEKVIQQVNNLINTYYIFMGYEQFANYIIKTINVEEESMRQKKEKIVFGSKKSSLLKDYKIELNQRIIRKLRAEFDNRMIVIDEVHNIRKTADNDNKKVAFNLELLVKSAQNMRFLLLSATPMYNSYKEIIWLTNLMNTNDRRARISVKDVFDKFGNFKPVGEDILIRKLTGYVSFVRGENPYTFPYRVYPDSFSLERTFPSVTYPNHQMNLKQIKPADKNRVLKLFLNNIGGCGTCGVCQYCVYRYIIYNLRKKTFAIQTREGVNRDMPSFQNMESFGYTILQNPLESLIISYPIEGLKEILDTMEEPQYEDTFSPSFSEVSSEETDETENELDEFASDDESGEPIEPIKDEDVHDDGLKADQPPPVSSSSEEEEEQGEEEEKEDILPNPLIEEKDKVVKDSIDSNSSKGGALALNPSPRFIDPHQLTGKYGLQRIMKFVDSKAKTEDGAGPLKGNFEYKKQTLDTYGRIFTREKIGQFSSKIKAILDSIYNPDAGGIVAEGIILIYSQYLESGLIPMALALEEMGFTRYGHAGVKSLFKKEKGFREPVDVHTMRPPEDRKQFYPARYSMITGDTRLSPNNDYEVKGATSDDNKNGEKVKIILISKAGSEGIDFKFIRQVHILEPWYNMNRIEQIIGRGVRNFSHKDLPFEKRNVQIFLHGTILEDNKEEAADLYVYRVAEFKAVQIGKVTRLLKETAVDCIINHDQTNFTQEKMNEILKTPIRQELSTGTVLPDFKIGDAPFSPACDYMAECNYSPHPNIEGELTEDLLNKDTYNESFIVGNSEKILQRIRMIMREGFFFKKENLIKEIRQQKEYPLIEIYSALTRLIEDNNEFIKDKYGRDGKLVNIGDYYLFQPLELKDKNASIFERTVPISYKHNMVNFEIKNDISKSVVDKRNIAEIKDLTVSPRGNPFQEGNDLFNEMNTNFETCREYTMKPNVAEEEQDWFKNCGISMRWVATNFPESRKNLIGHLVAHIIETLLFQDKINLMNYIYSLREIQENTLAFFIKVYIESNTVVIAKTKTIRGYQVYIFHVDDGTVIMKLNSDNVWIKSEPTDTLEIMSSKELREYLNINKCNETVGFIGYDQTKKFLIFKTLNTKSKRDTGARCDQAGKGKIITKTNEVIGSEMFTGENTKQKKDKHKNIIQYGVNTQQLCIIQEFVLRHFEDIKKDKKTWFLTFEMFHFLKKSKIL